MVLRNNHGDEIRFDPVLSVAGFFYAAVLLVAHSNGPYIELFGTATMIAILQWAAVGVAAITCAIVAVQVLRKKFFHYDASWAERILVITIGSLSFCLGAATLLSGEISVSLSAISGLLFGCGFVLLAASWGILYAHRSPQTILFHTTISVLIASAIFSLVLAAPFASSKLAVFICILVSIVASSIIAALRLRTPHVEAVAIDGSISLGFALASIGRFLWQPLFGAALVAFIVGLTFDPVLSDQVDNLAEQTLLQYLLGPALSAALIITSLRLSPKNFALHTMYETLLPVAIIVLMVVPFFGSDINGTIRIVGILSAASFSVVVIVFWALLSSSVRATSLSACIEFPFALACVSLAFALGTSLIHVVGSFGQTICLIVTLIYVIALIVAAALSKQRREQREIEHDATSRYVEERTERFAQKYALSKREKEVLKYLCHGYSQVYIAKELYISENTARTHVKHIYAKAGLHSREGLLERINSAEF